MGTVERSTWHGKIQSDGELYPSTRDTPLFLGCSSPRVLEFWIDGPTNRLVSVIGDGRRRPRLSRDPRNKFCGSMGMILSKAIRINSLCGLAGFNELWPSICILMYYETGFLRGGGSQ